MGENIGRLEIRREAHRVIGGKAGFSPVAFPHDPWAMDKVVEWTCALVAKAGALTDRQRAIFIRKLAVYAVRRGKRNFRDLDYLYATAWFARNPGTLESRLTFGGALRREVQHMARLRKQESREQRDTALADMERPPTDKPVVMTHGAFTLEELIHARHIVEAGQVANNCLIQFKRGRELPNPYYWLGIKAGYRHLFALRRGRDLCLLISIVDFGVTEMEFVRRPQDVAPVMPLVADALQRRFGTLWPAHNNLPWPPPPETPSSFLDPNQMFLPLGADA